MASDPIPPTPGLEVIADESDRKREGIRAEIKPIDRSAISNPDAHYRYRGVTIHPGRPGRIDEWKAKGYEIVPPDAKESWAYGGRRDKEKGMQVRGDQALARAPRAVYEERVRRAREKELRRIGQHQAETREKINRLARDGFDGTGKGRLAGPHQDVAFTTGSDE